MKRWRTVRGDRFSPRKLVRVCADVDTRRRARRGRAGDTLHRRAAVRECEHRPRHGILRRLRDPRAAKTDVSTDLRVLDLTSGSFRAYSGAPADLEPLRRTITNSVEAGWRGLLGGTFLVDAPVYTSRRRHLRGPLSVETPKDVGFALPAVPGARLTLSVHNLADAPHAKFVGAPVLGRLVMSRLEYRF
jgi:hypothetical protein